MRTAFVFLCFLAIVYCQTQNKNGNPTGEIGQPAFDEIVVESTLTVRGKSGSRSGKSLITNSKPEEVKTETTDGASVSLRRSRRGLRRRCGSLKAKHFGDFPLWNGNCGSSSSAAHASSNAFNSNSPFGSFGASASQSSSQSHSFGPGGFQGSIGQSAAQTYHLPDGSRIDLSYSASLATNNGNPTGSNSYSFTVTRPDGTVIKY